MKVLLVHPPLKQEIWGTDSYLPLGMAYIGAAMEEAGHKVEALDMLMNPMSDDRFADEVRRAQPDLVAFSVVTPAVKSVKRLAAVVKASSKAKVLLGGPHPTALADECLADPSVDFVIRSEGEDATVDLLAHLDKPEEVKGLSWKNGEIRHNPARPFLRELDKIPFPARHLFPDNRYYKGQPALGNRTPVGNILTSRGCPYSCNFCYKAVFGRPFRSRSPENVLAEWRYLIKEKGVKEIAIMDDVFTMDGPRTQAICEALIKEKMTIPWVCPNGIRADSFTRHPHLPDLMRKAGCYRVSFGIEHGNEEYLNKMGKHTKLEYVEKAVLMARKAGIETMGFFIIGNIGETTGTMQETIDFSKRLALDYAQFTIATPYPGTELYNQLSTMGARWLVKDWDEYGPYEEKVYFEEDSLPKEVVMAYRKKAFREFYTRPSYIAKTLLKKNSYLFFGRRFKAGLRFMKFAFEGKAFEAPTAPARAPASSGTPSS